MTNKILNWSRRFMHTTAAAVTVLAFGPGMALPAQAAPAPSMRICNAAGSSDLYLGPGDSSTFQDLLAPGQCGGPYSNLNGRLRVWMEDPTESFKAGWTGTGYTHPTCTNWPTPGTVNQTTPLNPPDAANGSTYTIRVSIHDNCVS